MATRLTFVCAGGTALARVGGFPHPDVPLDAGGARHAAALGLKLDRWDRIVSSPSRSAIETIAALGGTAEPDDALADMGFGDWAGLGFAEVEAVSPAALTQWFADPLRAAPGGEAAACVRVRVGAWMDLATARPGAELIVSHAMVLRAAIAHALGITLEATLQIDIAPLVMLDLSYTGRWRLQGLRKS